jgi:7,8-dihydroneopterin aldolase/epimerase/oxygenase
MVLLGSAPAIASASLKQIEKALSRCPVVGIACAFVDNWVVPMGIGILLEEQTVKQAISISIRVAYVDKPEAGSGVLPATFDYSLLLTAIRARVAQGHINLLEELAFLVEQEALAHPLVVGGWVKLAKTELLQGCNSLGIERTFVKSR